MARLTEQELCHVSEVTIGHYNRSAESFWEGTRDHDVSQNIAAFLRYIESEPPFSILDVGCGPGRDLATFRELGHDVVGLEGSANFVQMAKAHSGCEVLHQDFLKLTLPSEHFDGIFANASLFHVPRQELSRVLRECWLALKPGGVLFCSNPRGPDIEQWNGARYGCFLTWETWCEYMVKAGFVELEHFYRPAGLPRERQPWLASTWRKIPDG